MAKPLLTPAVHPKAPVTGLGQVSKAPTPGQVAGPSNSTPVTGKGSAGHGGSSGSSGPGNSGGHGGGGGGNSK